MSNNPTRGQQVKSGFRSAGGWLLGIAWFGLVLWGILEAFGTEANFSEGHHPSRLSGYLLLGVGAAVFVVSANRWKRILPGIMFAATLGALLELWHGHAVNNPSVLIPRWIALVQLVVIAGVASLSVTFKTRDLNMVDRIALLVFAASIYVGGDEATRQELPLALIVGGVCVLAAWAYDRLQRRPERNATA
ncbi:MAG: hypothetical protein GZ088_14540 [Acidipila sp.]|nr:hypothetical protein [Acidipila sp.]